MIHNNWGDGRFIRHIERQRALGKTIVVVNGCFDLLHMGHLRLLWAAMTVPMQDVGYHQPYVVVALNSDASVRRLKGKGRPFLPVETRARILDTLRCVDHVVVFDQDDPAELFREIRPDVLVKGSEYKETEIPGSQFCGRIVYVPQIEELSTTVLANGIATAVRSVGYMEKT